MSKKHVEDIIERASKDSDFYRRLDGARAALEVLSHYDLTAEERNALLTRDLAAFQQLGIAQELLKRADWCTGE
jgi:hypothetical protein